MLLIVIESPEDVNADVRNVLVTEKGPPDAHVRPEPYGAKIFTDSSVRDILVQLDRHQRCNFFVMRECLIRMGIDIMDPNVLYSTHGGLQCNLRIGHRPDEVMYAMDLIDNMETFFLQLEEVQALQEEVDQVICHVHGITPFNRPLGYRQLVLAGNDLVRVEWTTEMLNLWHFGDQQRRLVFCPMATDDWREPSDIRFHFILTFCTQPMIPILVHQQMLAVDQLQMDKKSSFRKTLLSGWVPVLGAICAH